MNKKIIFKAKSFRRLPNPYGEEGPGTPQVYEMYCDAVDVPSELLDWMETNPRKQNINNKVSKKIKESLITSQDFHLLNRGLLLSAEDVKFNNYDSNVTITFSDPEVHGDVDGGHTLRVIMENKEDLDPNQQYVKVEILTGVEQFFEDLAEARNTSTQVKDESINNLKNNYEMIKKRLANQPYADRINYMENDDGDIEIGEILAILNMFNIEKYPDMQTNPVTSYSSKKKCIDLFTEYFNKVENSEISKEDNPYYKMLDIMPDFFDLYDKLECNIAEYYKQKNSGGRYGATAGVTTAKEGKHFNSKFGNKTIDHSTPKGFLYPILGSFRALVKEENGKYKWKADPFKILDSLGPELVNSTVERSRQNGSNPNKTGKDVTLWPALYMRVLLETINM